MDLWHGSVSEFVKLARAAQIAGRMASAFEDYFGFSPSPGEAESWAKSLPVLASVLGNLENRDACVVCEYKVPLSGQRLDVLLLGTSSTGKDVAVVLENKQWQDVRVDAKAHLVFADGEFPPREHVHPSQQAEDYSGWLTDTHSAFVDGDIEARACSFLHNLSKGGAAKLRGNPFKDLVERVPVFGKADAEALRAFLNSAIGAGRGEQVYKKLGGGRFKPGPKLLEQVRSTVDGNYEWHLSEEQRVAFERIRSLLGDTQKKGERAVVLVKGGPGTGKSVIAVQLAAAALKDGLAVAHTTAGKAFTTTLRSKFEKAGQKIFRYNYQFHDVAVLNPGSMDLLLVDEAHRLRKDSNTPYRKLKDARPQVEELIDASKVTVFLLDDNQFVRPDEVGRSDLVRETAKKMKRPLYEYDLTLQFRCGGCVEYLTWLDNLLGFSDAPVVPWSAAYRVRLVETPGSLDDLMAAAHGRKESARIVAGFCWPWSDPEEGKLVQDVVIGRWKRPWNAKPVNGKAYTPKTDPYRLWAETPAGEGQVGCIYSAQGFEFDSVGVIWGPDLVWRSDRWVAQVHESRDKPVKSKGVDADRLIRNAYRVLLSRGARETGILCLDPETRDHIKSKLKRIKQG